MVRQPENRNNGGMTKQADLGLELSARRTCKRVFLDEMERVMPWAALLDLIALGNLWMMRQRILQGAEG